MEQSILLMMLLPFCKNTKLSEKIRSPVWENYSPATPVTIVPMLKKRKRQQQSRAFVSLASQLLTDHKNSNEYLQPGCKKVQIVLGKPLGLGIIISGPCNITGT